MGNTCHGRSSSLWCWKNEFLLPTNSFQWAKGKAFCSDMSVLSCMSMSKCQVNAAKSFGISLEASGGSVSLPSPNPAPSSTFMETESLFPQRVAATAIPCYFFFESISIFISFLEGVFKPSWCYDYSEFPFSCCQPFLKQ